MVDGDEIIDMIRDVAFTRPDDHRTILYRQALVLPRLVTQLERIAPQ